jgi:ubiquinone/menaquinone biosynthesis C-methylase UbiE
MNERSWGPAIWEDKSRHHDAVGVIMGTGFSRRQLADNTQHHLVRAEKYFLSRLPPGGTILDVGTGPAARFAIVFSQRGFRVTGLDGSSTALGKAALATQQAGLDSIQLIEADFSKFNIGEEFDGIFCAETFFHLPGHLTLPAFTSFHRHLKTGGIAWIQFAVLNEMTPSWLSKQLVYMTAFQLLKPIRKWTNKKSFYVTVTRHAEAEIEDLARLSGFTIEARLGDYFLLRKSHIPTWTL